MHESDTASPFQPSAQPAAQGRRPSVLWWVLGAFSAVALLGCGGILAFVVYVGAYSPETSVYVGNQVPASYLETARELGALNAGEQVLFFYSDGFMDIREGFYFVSDSRVVIYIEDAVAPLTSVPFDQIADADLQREESFFEDSWITLELKDGGLVSFPVSSEFERDVKFFEAIEARMTAADSAAGDE